MTFALFDPRSDYTVRHGALPHWYQPGATYFVTFRTADSVPRSLLRTWHAQREDWLRRHQIDPRVPSWKAALRSHADLERTYERTFTRQFMEYLDRGHGACALADPAAAAIVGSALQHFDGQRYRLGDFVVMPNHVHLLVCLVGENEIEAQCRSWKKYTAGEINRALGQRGRFWQQESFDHLVRTPEQFVHLQRYIANNPKNARLATGTYLYVAGRT